MFAGIFVPGRIFESVVQEVGHGLSQQLTVAIGFKPFGARELVARVRAVLRRRGRVTV